jgi:two-component system, cell cycle sensor histidine kinase and response regulator CckA
MTAMGPGPTILVVDDEPLICLMLQALLGQFGFRSLLASTGAEALSQYRQRPQEIDGVLLDINLPDTDGFSLLGQLRTLRPDVRCCFMTGADDPTLLERIRAARAIGFLEKPFANFRAVEKMMRTLGGLDAACS